MGDEQLLADAESIDKILNAGGSLPKWNLGWSQLDGSAGPGDDCDM